MEDIPNDVKRDLLKKAIESLTATIDELEEEVTNSVAHNPSLNNCCADAGLISKEIISKILECLESIKHISYTKSKTMTTLRIELDEKPEDIKTIVVDIEMAPPEKTKPHLQVSTGTEKTSTGTTNQ